MSTATTQKRKGVVNMYTVFFKKARNPYVRHWQCQNARRGSQNFRDLADAIAFAKSKEDAEIWDCRVGKSVRF